MTTSQTNKKGQPKDPKVNGHTNGTFKGQRTQKILQEDITKEPTQIALWDVTPQ